MISCPIQGPALVLGGRGGLLRHSWSWLFIFMHPAVLAPVDPPPPRPHPSMRRRGSVEVVVVVGGVSKPPLLLGGDGLFG